jgi:hypothetical protein
MLITTILDCQIGLYHTEPLFFPASDMTPLLKALAKANIQPIDNVFQFRKQLRHAP